MEPAYKATITDLLTEEQFAKASGLVQLAASSKYLLSPVIAGFLLGIADIKTILIIDISTFLVTVLAVLAVKKSLQSTHKAKAHQSFVKDLKEGWLESVSAIGMLIGSLIIGIFSIKGNYINILAVSLGLAGFSFLWWV